MSSRGKSKTEAESSGNFGVPQILCKEMPQAFHYALLANLHFDKRKVNNQFCSLD